MEPVHEFTSDELIEALRAVVAERPEHVYKAPTTDCHGLGVCMYVHDAGTPDARPGCGVGAALARLGVPLNQLSRHESESADDVISEISRLHDVDPAVRLAHHFQLHQDDGYPWSDALADAAEEAGVPV